jgi:hypothetical protein
MDEMQAWLDGQPGARDPLEQQLLSMYRKMVEVHGEGNFEIKVEAGSLYMLPPGGVRTARID